MSTCKNWLCSGNFTTTPIAREQIQAQSNQINPDLFNLFNQFYHKNQLLSLILKRKGGEQKITLKILKRLTQLATKSNTVWEALKRLSQSQKKTWTYPVKEISESPI
jgi:hypothetical protein